MKALLLVPHSLASDRRNAIEEGRRPKPDYDALVDKVRSLPRGEADILDRSAVDREHNPLIRLVRLVAGYNWALALLGLLKCRRYDVVFSHAENVGMPFALMLMALSKPPRHVMQAYYLTGRRNKFWYRLLAIDRRIDAIFTLSKQQYEVGVTDLAIAEHKLILVETYGFIDVDFFKANASQPVNERQVCAVGREFRDYGTLFRAVGALPGVSLKVEANSPWSVHPSEIDQLEIPSNVEVCSMEFGTVRQLYDRSAVVAIPLYPNAIGAGLTSLLEAMAMGKAVIITRSEDATYAGRKQIVDGENVLMVGSGDVEGWKAALTRLLEDAQLRARLGESARRWVEQNASRQQWLDLVTDALRPETDCHRLTLVSQRS